MSEATGDGVALEVPPEDLVALRRGLERIAPPHVLRFVLRRAGRPGPGAARPEDGIVEAVLDVAGNLVPFSLGPRLREDPVAAGHIEAALAGLAARSGPAARSGDAPIEVVLDADGGHEVRVGAESSAGSGWARHDAAYHVSHRAPDLEELRDRIRASRLTPARRWWKAIRARLMRRE